MTTGERGSTPEDVRRILVGQISAGQLRPGQRLGPAGLLPFDRRHSPAEWRAVRLRLKQAVFAVNLRRALAILGAGLGQVLIVGGPAGDDEMLGVLLRSLPAAVAVGRGNVGGTLAGTPAGHRYAAALGLALAGND